MAHLMGGGDDTDLLVSLRRRDPEAVGVLYDRYGKAAYRLALRMLKDSGQAEALVAESILKCWNRVASFKESRGSALGVWLLLTTYAGALELRRRGHSDAAEQCSHAIILERGTLFQDWSRSLNADHVQESFIALNALTAEERLLLDSAFFEAYPPGELAALVNRTPGEVDHLIQSALAKLVFLDHE